MKQASFAVFCDTQGIWDILVYSSLRSQLCIAKRPAHQHRRRPRPRPSATHSPYSRSPGRAKESKEVHHQRYHAHIHLVIVQTHPHGRVPVDFQLHNAPVPRLMSSFVRRRALGLPADPPPPRPPPLLPLPDRRQPAPSLRFLSRAVGALLLLPAVQALVPLCGGEQRGARFDEKYLCDHVQLRRVRPRGARPARDDAGAAGISTTCFI